MDDEDDVEKVNTSASSDSVVHDVDSAKQPRKRRMKVLAHSRHWVKKNLRAEWPDFKLHPKKFTGCIDPVAMFEYFFDDDVFHFWETCRRNTLPMIKESTMLKLMFLMSGHSSVFFCCPAM